MNDDFILLADSAFFAKTISVPEGVAERDLSNFADIALETFCPLPPDKTRRAYIVRNGALTIFAALEENIFADLQEETLKSAKLVTPTIALASAAGLGDGFTFLRGKNSLSLIFEKSGMWENFWTLPSEETKEKLVKESLLELALDEVEIPEPNKIPTLQIADIKLARGKLCFEIVGGEQTRNVELTLKRISSADVRAKSFNEKNRKLAARENALLWSVRLALLTLAILFGWQALLWQDASKLTADEIHLNTLRPIAAEIEKKSEESRRLANFSSEKLHGIQTLAQINQYRPDNIVFARYTQQDPHTVEINGTAQNLAQINTFVKNLEKFKNLERVESKTESAAKGAKFSIKIHLKK